MAVCNFCGRSFGSSQGVIAHLRHCQSYKQQRQRPSTAPRPQRALTDKQHIERLLGTAPSSARRPTASPVPEPRPVALRPNLRPEADRFQERRALEAGREREEQREAQQREAERQQAAEQRRRAERTRGVIQQLKFFVVDC